MTPEEDSTHDAVAFADSVVDVAEVSPQRARRRWIGLSVALLGIAALVGAWSLTPLREWIDLDRLAAFARGFSESPAGPFIMIAMFVMGGLLLVPVNVLTAVALLVFGAAMGSVYALIGAVLSAAVLYEIGLRIPMRTLRARFGSRLQTIHTHLLRHGVLAVALVRLVPVAPYSIVCLLLGVLRIRRLQYVVGTTLGMAPGIIVNAFFIDRVVAAMRSPSLVTLALVLLAVAIIVALGWFVRKRLARHAP